MNKPPVLKALAVTLSLCAISNLALGQSVEPQLEAPEPDITTFDAGESYTTTFDTKNDINIRILDGGVLVNGLGYTMYNNDGGTLDNFGTLFNEGTLNNFSGGTLDNSGTLKNDGTLDNVGSLNNSGTLNNDGFLDNNFGGTLTNNIGGTLTNGGTLYNDGTLNNNVGGTLTNSGTLINDGTLYNDGTLNNFGTLISSNDVNAGTIINNGFHLGPIINEGTYINSGEVRIPDFAFTTNRGGVMTNNVGAVMNIASLSNGEVGTSVGGTINNQGTFNIIVFNNGELSGELSGGARVDNSKGSLFNNSGTLNVGTASLSEGDSFNGGGSFSNTGGTLDNSGYVRIRGTLTNYGFRMPSIVNNSGLIDNYGTLENRFGTLNNSGTINNYDGGTINNSDSMTNNSEGALNNYGTFNNNYYSSSSTLDNFGTINNDGIINSTSGAVSEISGIQNHGILRNNGTINGSVDVKASGILTGSGTINGSVLLGGVIAPANSTGTITTSNQTWINGASYGWEINNSDGTAGGLVGWDLVDITATEIEDGSLDLSQLTTGGFGIDIISLDVLNAIGAAEGFDDPNGEYEFVIVTTFAGITGFEAEDFVINDDDFQNSGTWEWSIAQDGNNLVLSATGYTLVPEPSSLALLGMGGLGLMLRRRR